MRIEIRHIVVPKLVHYISWVCYFIWFIDKDVIFPIGVSCVSGNGILFSFVLIHSEYSDKKIIELCRLAWWYVKEEELPKQGNSTSKSNCSCTHFPDTFWMVEKRYPSWVGPVCILDYSHWKFIEIHSLKANVSLSKQQNVAPTKGWMMEDLASWLLLWAFLCGS